MPAFLFRSEDKIPLFFLIEIDIVEDRRDLEVVSFPLMPSRCNLQLSPFFPTPFRRKRKTGTPWHFSARVKRS